MQVSSCPAKLSHVEDYYYGMEVSPCRGKFSCHADSIWRDDAQFAAHSNEVDWNLRSEHAWAMACRLNGKMIWPPPLEIQTGVEELEEENKRIVELNKVVDAFCEALAPKYNEILARLREAEDYKDALRNENAQLQAEMAELEQRNLFKEAQIRMLFRDELYAASPVSVQSLSPPSAGSFSIPEKGLNRSISDNIPLVNPSALSDLSQNGANVSMSSNNYLTQQNFINQSDSKKPKSNIGPALPKSISIRTNSLLGIKTKSLRCVRQRSLQRDQESSSKTTSLPSLSLQSTEKDKSKVLEQHSNIVETMSLEIMEWEVFVQGMYKTELCNKWQKQGNCPYGSRCQFAHGVEELRPVLRHPRYKTELCRMIGNGETCPYGHRCHFRHSLTKEEKRKLAAPNL